MVEQGEDLRILDNKTKEDITNATLAQIIFEREKGKENVLPLSTLRSIIQSGEQFTRKLDGVTQVKDCSGKLEDQALNSVQEFFNATRLSLDDMQDKIDVRFKGAVDQLTQVPVLERDIYALDLRLRAVEKSLNRIEQIFKSQAPLDLSGISNDPHQNLPQ